MNNQTPEGTASITIKQLDDFRNIEKTLNEGLANHFWLQRGWGQNDIYYILKSEDAAKVLIEKIDQIKKEHGEKVSALEKSLGDVRKRIQEISHKKWYQFIPFTK